MKKLTAALALLALASTTQAEFQMRKVIICDKDEVIFTQLLEKFQEEPVWTGHSPNQDTDLVLTENRDTGAWTLVEFKDNIACVLAVGEKSNHRMIKSRLNT